jgi:K+-sensing histidine kinase KdpD
MDHQQRIAVRYGVAVLSVAVALALTLLLLSIRDTPFVFPFFAAVAASAWFGGAGPGWLAIVLSTLVVDYFFIPPPYALTQDHKDVPFLLAFVICAVLAHIVSLGRRRAEQSLRQAQVQLEARVDERTAELRRANEALRESERRYRNIFQAAGVSIWEVDFSEVKAAFDVLRAQGVGNVRQYLTRHPEFLRHAAGLLKVVDVNDTTVRLFGGPEQGRAARLTPQDHLARNPGCVHRSAGRRCGRTNGL